jgi:hypothetical protein
VLKRTRGGVEGAPRAPEAPDELRDGGADGDRLLHGVARADFQKFGNLLGRQVTAAAAGKVGRRTPCSTKPAAALRRVEDHVTAARTWRTASRRASAELRLWIASPTRMVTTSTPRSRGARRTPDARRRAHLLDLGGKRIRPLCVALAARAARASDRAARDLAVAAELVHNATLLHDDVVDVGDRAAARRPRGCSTATRRRSTRATGCWSRRCGASARRA